MRAIVVYYMLSDLMMSQAQSSMIFGVYVAFFYLTPLLAGIAADRWLGRRRAIILGGAIMALGHFPLNFAPTFYAGLAVLVIGNGFFLPAIRARLGDLYVSRSDQLSVGKDCVRKASDQMLPVP